MKLISHKTLELVNALELAEGEISEEINMMLLDLSKSADQSGLFLDRAEAITAHLKSLVDQIKSKISTIEKAQDFVKSEIKKSISIIDSDLEGDIYKFKLSRTAPKVVIENEDLIVEPYIRYKQVCEVDKKAIAEALKKGETIEGAHLEENYSLRKSIQTNKIKEVKDV
jgi:hypothetical protein